MASKYGLKTPDTPDQKKRDYKQMETDGKRESFPLLQQEARIQRSGACSKRPIKMVAFLHRPP